MSSGGRLDKFASLATILGLPIALLGVYFAYLQVQGVPATGKKDNRPQANADNAQPKAGATVLVPSTPSQTDESSLPFGFKRDSTAPVDLRLIGTWIADHQGESISHGDLDFRWKVQFAADKSFSASSNVQVLPVSGKDINGMWFFIKASEGDKTGELALYLVNRRKSSLEKSFSYRGKVDLLDANTFEYKYESIFQSDAASRTVANLGYGGAYKNKTILFKRQK